MTTTQSTIIKKLDGAFSPDHLEVINESAFHNVPEGSESHFKVVLVSQSFEGQSAVKRHQSVYVVLAAELQSGVHALALHTYLPDEWKKQHSVPNSPDCLGGSD
ncbi:BolA/IbaG family iron-sulfur metabolism protein [Porticoccaceae bacterium]|jgi:stress-induced morphogen|nr:BolA/IbaG family iron-sulfur metabolism protein [Porticoccaceae bacterium]MDA8898886.1 BolA/IbaG family iron-sulfur metabolism protein [Porticoccaceae bacterium]